MSSTPASRGRGRPRKSDAAAESTPAVAAVTEGTPRGRGRPSTRAPGEAEAKVTKPATTGRRGRPPKDANAPPKPAAAKKESSGRPRGRPRLYAPGESPTAIKIAAKRAAAKKDGRGRPRKSTGVEQVKKMEDGQEGGEEEEEDEVEDGEADANGENEDEIDEDRS